MYKIEFDPVTRMVVMCSYVRDGEPGGGDGWLTSDSPVFERAWVNAEGEVVRVGQQPTASHQFDVAAKEWVDMRSLEQVIESALVMIDEAAGKARLRYITSVPGQAETYAKKEEQARQWAAASFAGDAPSFIAAESVALGVSAQSVAEEVIALADYWANVKGPQIEACRRKWKVAAGAATSTADVQALLESARLELEAL